MILGYAITVPDIKSEMLYGMKLEECSSYSNIYDLNLLNPKFKMKTKKYNISCTYDGFTIVSDKFRRFCEDGKYSGLEFVELPSAPLFFWFKIHNILKFDLEERETQLLNYNERCKGYEEVIGATPVCLKERSPLSDNFFRTDVFFGSFAGKSPIYITGTETKEKLFAAGFSEIYFERILDKYNWQNGH